MKKFFFKSVILALAALMAVSVFVVAACGEDETAACEHDVSEWTVVQEATCMSEGLKEGVCGICYETVQETIPIDEDAHTYGDWEVAAPTLERTGIAIKTCIYNENHYKRVTLPTLDDEDGVYTSGITVMPTANSNGVSTYTYEHELGDITFEVEIDSSGVQTVSDAVGVGSNEASHALIRSVTGTRGTGKTSTVSSEAVAMTYSSFEYYLYSENSYTKVTADDGKVYYMGLDGDEIYGYVEDDVTHEVTVTSDKNLYYGYKYYLARTESVSDYYGTENFLAELYAYGKANYNGDFTQSIGESNGKTVYTFSFGTKTIYASGRNGARFSIITVSFTLTKNFTIETLTCDVDTYENDSSTYDASTGTWTSEAYFDFDENGYAYVKDKDYEHYDEIYEVTQTEKASGDVVETNPYSADTRFYTDFDIAYNDTVISENQTIQAVAGTSTGYVFSITNLTPSTVIGDDIKFYYRNNGTDTLVNYGTESSVGILIYVSNNKFYIKSNIAGTLTFVAKSRNVEKTFKVNFSSVAPTKFYSTVYEYTSSNIYRETTSGTNSATATVYVGQPLYYKASLDASEQGSHTETFATTVAGASSDTVYTVVDAYALTLDPMDSTSEQVSVSSFTAYEAGTYTLTLTSTVASSVTCTITVTVEPMPEMSTLLSGTYTGTYNLSGQSGASVTVTFGTDASTQIFDSDNTTVLAVRHDVEVAIKYSYSGKSSDLTLIVTYYTNPTDFTVITSSYVTAESAPEILSSEMYNEDSGAYDDDEIFRLTFNDEYSFVLSHNSGSDGEQEQIILLKSST